MAKITGNGAPTKRTSGAIGDIYVDSKTGAEYKCTFAYRLDSEFDFECEWKKTGAVHTITKGQTPSPEIDQKVENVIIEKDEPEYHETAQKPGKKDYTAYNKKNR